jgi:hypothetical protein
LVEYWVRRKAWNWDEGMALGSILGIVLGTTDGVELGSPPASPLGVEESIGLSTTVF